jgi:hypothetical protein
VAALKFWVGAYEWDRDLSWQDIRDHVARALYLCGSGGSLKIAQLGAPDCRLPTFLFGSGWSGL